jgi:hypothetical protein
MVIGILASAVLLVGLEGLIFRALAIWAFPDDDATEEAD